MVASAYRQAGIDVKVLPPGSSLNQFGKAAMTWGVAKKAAVVIREYLPYTFQLARLIQKDEIDILHANDPRATLIAGAAARLTRRPLVAHLRGELPITGLYRKAFFALSDHIIAVSRATKRRVETSGRVQSTVVYNGTEDVSHLGAPIPWLSALRRSGVMVTCHFASVVPGKGHHHLLDAAAELNRRGWRDKFVILCVGDVVEEGEEYYQWLLARQRELGVNNLFFTGWQSDPFSFYQSADVTVLPSVRGESLSLNGRIIHVPGGEGFPRTHLEAMSFSLPIVSTDVGGVAEQVEDGLNGFLVPPSDPDAMADALERLAEDPVRREQMGQAGKRRVRERFSTAAYVQGVTQVYRKTQRT